MFGFGEAHENYQEVYNDDRPQHEAKFSHEAIAGAVSFAAFKAFEDRQRREGKTVNHAFAKEALVGLVGAEIDRLAETKGMDFYDKERAKHRANQGVQQMYDSHYGGNNQYDPNSQDPPSHIQRYSDGRW